MTAFDIVDIHTHLWPSDWAPGGRHARPVQPLPPNVVAKITSPETQAAEFQQGGVSLGVATATIESLFGLEGPVDFDALREANDWLAVLAAGGGPVEAFGTTDAFAGEQGAREAERAIVELGLSGLIIDSSRAGKFAGDATVRSTLEVAARHRVPVFIHPVSHPDAQTLVAGAGASGNSLGRGLMNGVSFLSIIQSTLLDELPDLHLIFATLGLGAIVQASRGGRYGRAERTGGQRPNIYFDTMGDDPAIIRALVGFFGVERVLAGTDWPILGAFDQAALRRSLAEAGLDETEQRLVAGGNARRLLGLR